MSRMPSSPSGRIWLALLGIGISVAALWIAVRNVDLAFVAQRLAQADVRYLLGALAVGAIQIWLRTVRWQLLLPARPDGSRARTHRLLPVVLIGYLGNVALPARLGELVRTYLVSRRESLDPVSVLGTVVLERILDVVALAGFAFIVALAVGAPPWMVGAAALAAAIGSVALVVAIAGLPTVVRVLGPRFGPATATSRWRPLLLRVAGRFSVGLSGSRKRPAVAGAAALSFIAWPLDALLVWLVASSIDIDISLGAAALISAAAVLSTAVPSAPGYVGTYELAAAVAAQAMGVASSPAFALAVLAHAFTILPAAVAGAICLVLLRDSLRVALPRSDPPLEATPDYPAVTPPRDSA